jgi:hypothetical protein
LSWLKGTATLYPKIMSNLLFHAIKNRRVRRAHQFQAVPEVVSKEVTTQDAHQYARTNSLLNYIVELSKPEKTELVENFRRFERLKHSTVLNLKFEH